MNSTRPTASPKAFSIPLCIQTVSKCGSGSDNNNNNIAVHTLLSP